jgi:hypothetical protein
MYDTATKAQFIDLRARGWSYDKIARHTGISKTTLLNWGRTYAEDIENLKSDYISPRIAFPDGTAQETYFHNLEGYPAEPAQDLSDLGGRERNSPQVKVPQARDRVRGERTSQSYFHNLPGESAPEPKTRNHKLKTRRPKTRRSRLSTLSKRLSTRLRRLARSPLVRTVLRIAISKR